MFSKNVDCLFLMWVISFLCELFLSRYLHYTLLCDNQRSSATRPRRRPRRKWIDDIKDIVQSHGMTISVLSIRRWSANYSSPRRLTAEVEDDDFDDDDDVTIVFLSFIYKTEYLQLPHNFSIICLLCKMRVLKYFEQIFNSKFCLDSAVRLLFLNFQLPRDFVYICNNMHGRPISLPRLGEILLLEVHVNKSWPSPGLDVWMWNMDYEQTY